MKVTHGGSNVIASQGIQSETQFQISASAHAFRILSSGLYSDKIGAVLREIGCNAADSHIAAKIADRPIEVKLPTKLDHQFYIKDWGLGLNHQEITGLFTTYFSSNKSDTNDMTGAFGLGSKSPFSYTDSFSVTSAKEGIQRSYTAHIGSDGSPVISLLAEVAVDADWPTGLMVSFPVDPKDQSEFHTKAAQIYRWFKVKPTILGGTSASDLEFGIKGSNFYLSETRSCADIDKAQVLMGNVAYPLNAERLGNKNPMINALINANIQVLMPIGSVMPTASREDLEYDPRTRQNLVAVLKAAGKELAAMVRTKAMEPAKSEWLRHVRILEFKKLLPNILTHDMKLLLDNMDVEPAERTEIEALYREQFKMFPDWIGGFSAVTWKDASTTERSLADRQGSFQVWIATELERRSGFAVTRKQVHHGKIHRGQTAEKAMVEYKTDVEVIYSDTTHAYPRVRAYVQEHGKVIVMVAATYREGAAGTKAYAERVAADLGGLSIKATSSLLLPEIVRARSSKPGVRRAAFANVYAQTSMQYASFDKASKGGVTGDTTQVKLSEVAETGRYYLSEVVTGRRRRITRFHVDVPDVGQRTLEAKDIDQVMIAYQAMRGRGVPLLQIDGAVRLSPGDLVKYKLKENGWKPLLDTVIEAMLDKAVAKDLGRRLTNMPLLDMSHYYYLRQAGLVGLLIKSHKEQDNFWKVWEPIASQFPVLTTIAMQASAANDARNVQAGTRVLLTKLLELLPLKLKGACMKQMTAEELAALVQKTYPLTRFMQVEEFLRIALKHPDEAVSYLQRILIPADKLTTAPEQVPQAMAS